MSVAMPPVIVLIACKVISAGAPDPNAQFTHAENLQWATENSMMVCRRYEVQMFDQAESLGADPQPFNDMRCMQSAMRLGPDFDSAHRNTPWRFWRAACPTKIIDTRTGKIIGYKLPECGHQDTVVCEVDSAI